MIHRAHFSSAARIGPLEIQVEKKAKRIVQRQRKVDLSQADKPQTGIALLKATGDETTTRVAEIDELLHDRLGEPDNGQSMGFFECIVNPRSFSQTVENMFHLSFLVKEGNVALQHDADGLPRLCVCGLLCFCGVACASFFLSFFSALLTRSPFCSPRPVYTVPYDQKATQGHGLVADRHQSVFTLQMDEYEEIIKVCRHCPAYPGPALT